MQHLQNTKTHIQPNKIGQLQRPHRVRHAQLHHRINFLDAGYALRERLTIYPEYLARDEFLHPDMRGRVRAMADADGLARDEAPRPLTAVAL